MDKFIQSLLAHTIDATKTHYNKSIAQYVLLCIQRTPYLVQLAICISVLNCQKTPLMNYCNTCQYMVFMLPKFIIIESIFNMCGYILQLCFIQSNLQYVYLHSTIKKSSREFLKYVPVLTANASKIYYNKSNMQYMRLCIAFVLYLCQIAICKFVLHYEEIPLGNSCNTCQHALLMLPMFIIINPICNVCCYILLLQFTYANVQYIHACCTIRKPLLEMLQYVGQRIAIDLYIYFISTYSQVQGYKLYQTHYPMHY